MASRKPVQRPSFDKNPQAPECAQRGSSRLRQTCVYGGLGCVGLLLFGGCLSASVQSKEAVFVKEGQHKRDPNAFDDEAYGALDPTIEVLTNQETGNPRTLLAINVLSGTEDDHLIAFDVGCEGAAWVVVPRVATSGEPFSVKDLTVTIDGRTFDTLQGHVQTETEQRSLRGWALMQSEEMLIVPVTHDIIFFLGEAKEVDFVLNGDKEISRRLDATNIMNVRRMIDTGQENGCSINMEEVWQTDKEL